MIAIAYYLLKVILCSGVLYGYYHLALKDKLFHQWNRFYLLGSMILSVGLPLVQINVTAPVRHSSTIITALEMVNGADEYVREASARPSAWLNGEFLSMVAYGLVSIGLLVLFLVAIFRIYSVIRRYQQVAMDDFFFLNTTEPGTPFSHFRYLLWNREISLDTENGQRILAHELVHIREKHSWDKVLVQLFLVAFWINPFFWLIRRELVMVHEFIADRKTVGNGDAQALSRLLLETGFPGYAPLLTNAFFTSSIKRRLTMITKEQHPALSYLSRLMMIPVLFILLFTFGVKARTMLTHDQPSTLLDKKYTVVIDAGHGGTDGGAVNGQTHEKDLNLAIARLVKKLNNNPNLNVVLTRDADVFHNVKEKVDITKKANADLFVSIHINAAPDAISSGMEVVVAGLPGNPFSQQSTRLATLLVNNVSTVYKTEKAIQKRDSKVYVLDQNICPAAIVELGYITNNEDLSFITNAANQEKLAKKVLQSIEDYFNPSLQVQQTSSAPATDLNTGLTTVSKDTSIKPKTETREKDQLLLKAGQLTYGDVMISSDTIYVKAPISPSTKKSLPTDVRYTIDGKPSYPAAVERLKPEDIFSIYVNKGNSPSDKGSIDILTKAGIAADPNLVNKTNAARTTASPVMGVQVKPSVTTSVGTTTGTQVVSSAKPTVTTEPATVTVSGLTTTHGQGPKIVLANQDPNAPKPLYIVDGKEITEEEIQKINPDLISEINVLKGDSATKAYGDKGKNGVLIIKLKK